MKAHQSGIAAILEIASSDLDHQLNPDQLASKDELMNIIQNYLNCSSTYEQCCEAFLSIGVQTDTLDKIKEIKSVEEAPLAVNDGDGDSSHKKSRPWSAVEDARLLAGILRYGLENWSTVAMFVGNDRSRAQCSQRWSRGLNPRISKDTWSPEEESLLLRLIQQFGDKSWTKIASLLGNRSDVQCRYHYHQINKNSQTLAFGSAPNPPINMCSISVGAPHYRNIEQMSNLEQISNFEQISVHAPFVRQPPRFSLPNVTFTPLMVSPNSSTSRMLPPIPAAPPNSGSAVGSLSAGFGGGGIGGGITNINESFAIPTLNSKFRSISAGAVETQQHFAGPSQIATLPNSSDFDLEEINIDGFLRRFQ